MEVEASSSKDNDGWGLQARGCSATVFTDKGITTDLYSACSDGCGEVET